VACATPNETLQAEARPTKIEKTWRKEKRPGCFSRAHLYRSSNCSVAYAFAAALNPFTATLNRDL
jgi:hypothetical protein